MLNMDSRKALEQLVSGKDETGASAAMSAIKLSLI